VGGRLVVDLRRAGRNKSEATAIYAGLHEKTACRGTYEIFGRPRRSVGLIRTSECSRPMTLLFAP